MKICLVSNEILGAHKNGGIGTATSHLSILLASLKVDVSILYVGYDQIETGNSWVRKYRSLNITLETLPTIDQTISPPYMSLPIRIFNTLKNRDLDVIIFQDWLALGHSCAVQKSCGKYFQNTELITIAHSPTAWIAEANQRILDSTEFALDHMEREAIRLSDTLIGPSQYLLDWMSEKGWQLPKNTIKIPYYFCDEPSAASSESRPQSRQSPVQEIVFFGRLEERKGIVLFLDALSSKDLPGIEEIRITFLGREATHSEKAIRQHIGERRPSVANKLKFIKDYGSEDAQRYLQSPGLLAVVPSLTDNSPCVIYECIRNRIAFLAASSGGIPEIVRPADHGAVLFEPTARALVSKLRDVLGDRATPAPATAAHSSEAIANAWQDVLDRSLANRHHASVPLNSGQIHNPLVTVVVTHYERPHLLRQCLHSLELQTMDNFRVIVVDDGSQSEESKSSLSALEATPFRLQLKIVRQENRYVGAARNCGIHLADTEYVIFLDDDNLAYPTLVERLTEAITASQADVVTCMMHFFYETAGPPGVKDATNEQWAFPGGPVVLGMLQNCFGDATAIYRRNMFEKIGLFHEEYGVTHEDWQMHARISAAGLRLVSLPEPLFWYRVAKSSMIRNTNQFRNMARVWEVYSSMMSPDLSALPQLLFPLTQWPDVHRQNEVLRRSLSALDELVRSRR